MNLRELVSSLPFEAERSVCSTVNKKLHRRPSSEPFISGDTFRAHANVKFDCDDDFINPVIKTGDVVFVHTSMLSRFISEVLPQICVPFTLVTHQSDIIIDNSDSYRTVAENPFLINWFAENCTLEHPKIIPTPIGLENQYYHNNGNVASIKKLRRAIKKRSRRNARADSGREAKVLVAFNLATNPDARFVCYRAFWQKSTAHIASFASASVYRKHVSRVMFVASPSGNGLDCHRTWEAVYLGAIPLVEDNYMNRFFVALGLPIVIVPDWKTFAEKSSAELASLYEETMQNANTEAAYIDFWLKKMNACKAEKTAHNQIPAHNPILSNEADSRPESAQNLIQGKTAHNSVPLHNSIPVRDFTQSKIAQNPVTAPNPLIARDPVIAHTEMPSHNTTTEARK